MKITPSNQALILAGERRNLPATSRNSPAKSATSSGSVLQRVTIVAARPDTTVLYLRADYSPATDTPVASGSTSSRVSSYLNPVEQYARTQRILGVVSRVPQIDVHA